MKINIDLIYPVGSIYMSVLDTHPSTLFGGGWERIAQGRCLMGEGVVQPNTDNWCGTVNAGDWTAYGGLTGGEVFHTLTVSQMPAHKHGVGYLNGSGNYVPQGSTNFRSFRYNSNVYSPYINGVLTDISPSGYTQENFIQNTGGGGSHNNLPPYLVVYMWKRVS